MLRMQDLEAVLLLVEPELRRLAETDAAVLRKEGKAGGRNNI